MFEQDLFTFLTENIESNIYWGKISSEYVYTNESTTINYFLINNASASLTPSFLYQLQLSVRGKYIDIVQSKANEVVELFHLYSGEIGSYRVWVSDVITNSALYEEEDLVQIPITISVKFTGL